MRPSLSFWNTFFTVLFCLSSHAFALDIAASDIMMQANADIPFAQQSGYTTQCMNKYISAASIPETGITGPVLSNGETLRLGKVNAPGISGKKAFQFQLAPSDPTTSSSKRCEFSTPASIVNGRTYWIAFRMYIYDWGTLRSGDDSLFGTQLHSGDNSKGYSPSFTLTTAYNAGGRTYQVTALYNTTGGSSGSISRRFAARPIKFGQWVSFVIKFRHGINNNGLLQVWEDGLQIVNYTGNLGFNTPNFKDYAKFGYYNWSSAFNSPRKVLLINPMIVADSTGSKYAYSDLLARVSSGSTAPAPTPTPTLASCLFNGQTIASGSTVTAYQSSSVAAGSSCSSQIRTCSDGVLSGSYAFASCSVASAPTAPVSGSKLAVAGVSASTHDGNLPANVLDGNLGTRWSASGQGVNITLDLGSARKIDAAKIAFYVGNTRRASFELSHSNDGVSFTNVGGRLQSSGTTLNLETYNMSVASARYIRLTGYGNNSTSSVSSPWTSITEIEVHGSAISTTPIPTQPSIPSLGLTMEGEAMAKSGYVNDGTTGMVKIDTGLSTGTAKAYFNGSAGNYNLAFTIGIEKDGQSKVDLKVDGSIIRSLTYELASATSTGNFVSRVVNISGIALKNNSLIEIVGTTDAQVAWARFDKLVWSLVPTQLASCSFNNQTIASGSSVTAYQAASVPSGSTCVSQSRTCSNGILSGSYTFASCAVEPSQTTSGKLAVSNVSASENDGNVPANVLDGNLGTRWSASGQGVTLTLDLGSAKQISAVKIAFYVGNTRKTSFDLSHSNDGVAFTKATGTLQSSGISLNLETFNMSANARYVRITGYGNNSTSTVSQPWTSLTEVEVHGGASGPAAPTPSLAGTTIPPATQIIDNQLNVWTVSGGVVYRNSATAGFSANVVKLYWNGTSVFQQNAAGGWWMWTGTDWADSSSPETTPTPPPTMASCLFNGQTIASGSSVTAYQSSSVVAPAICASQTRTCSNGSLSGTYSFSSCIVDSGSVAGSYNFPASASATSSAALQLVPTFHNISMYFKPSEGSTSRTALVRYRIQGTQNWHQAHDMWFDDRTSTIPSAYMRQYRGSIVNVQSNTTYEVEVFLTGVNHIQRATVKTWDENFKIARTVRVTANALLNITSGGNAADGYVVYDGTGTTISTGFNNIQIRAPYVIVRGFTLRGAADEAIWIAPTGTSDIVIENNDISGWGPIASDGWAVNSGGIGTDNVSNVGIKNLIVQNNKFHHPRGDSNNWDEPRPSRGGNAHPYGAQSMYFPRLMGGLVFRNNQVYSDSTHYFNDCLGGESNFSYTQSFPGPDSDIYDNSFKNCWDDAIETEGQMINVRVYNNYTDQSLTGHGVSAVTVGPAYLFRNVYYRFERSPSNKNGGPWIKSQSRENARGGRVYIYHNTCFRDAGGGGGYAALSGLGWPLSNIQSRNNISTSGTHIDERGGPNDGKTTVNYDLYQGRINSTSASLYERNGIKVTAPMFDNLFPSLGDRS
jgi:hypothetical protein